VFFEQSGSENFGGCNNFKWFIEDEIEEKGNDTVNIEEMVVAL